MTTTIKIQDFRLSFIWFERQLASLENPVTDSAKALEAFLKGPGPAGNVLLGPLLGNNATYEQLFKAVYKRTYAPGKPSEDTPGGLALPWETTSRHHFWVYYLGNHEAQDVTARLAWNRFIPFYKKLKVIGLPKWFSLQAFYYPQGLALVATAYCTGDWTLYEAVERAQQIRADERFEITLPGKQPARYVLDDLATQLLDCLHDETWGQDTSGSSRLAGEPLSIFTMIQGKGAPPARAIPPDGQIHRALDGVTTWNRQFAVTTLTPADLDKANLLKNATSSSRRSPSGHVLYAVKNGRAVWFPGGFKKPLSSSRLACYHRNLLFASLQVESLWGLVEATTSQLWDEQNSKFGHPLTSNQSERTRQALDILGWLYQGDKSKTYRSWSARYQMDFDKLSKIKDLRAFFNMDPL